MLTHWRGRASVWRQQIQTAVWLSWLKATDSQLWRGLKFHWEKWLTNPWWFRMHNLYLRAAAWLKLNLATCVRGGVACSGSYMAQAAGRGLAGSITISISEDQGEAPSNPGLSAGSHTSQLELILPLLPPTRRTTENTAVSLKMGVCCGCGVGWGAISQLCTLDGDFPSLKPPDDH